MSLTVESHPIYRDQWCVMGPPLYLSPSPRIWYGPDTIWACLEAKRHLGRVLEAA